MATDAVWRRAYWSRWRAPTNRRTRSVVGALPLIHTGSLRERVGTELELHRLAQRARPALGVPHEIRRVRRPQAAALPSAVRIVDTAVQASRVEAKGIRNAHHDPLA